MGDEKIKPGSSPPCCQNSLWEPLADMGQAVGVDFDLGRCRSCKRYVMAAWHPSAPIAYVPLPDEFALNLLLLPSGEDRKKNLIDWWEAL